MSLVEELQAAALDRTVPVPDLLRRVKLAAAKLRLESTLGSVENELNGYSGPDTDVPSYRVASGSLMSTSLRHGTRRATGNAESIAALSVCFFREPVSSLEALLNSGGGQIVMPINLEFAKLLSSHSNDAYYVQFSLNVVASILDIVRNLVLDWAINLEGEGILGEGVSFTMEEKKKAADAAPNVQINNFGHYHQGDVTGHQNRTVIGGEDRSVNALSHDVFTEVRTTIENTVAGADRDVLLELIDRMEESKNTPSFRDYYNRFVVAAANYMTILGPFIPALTGFISS